MESNQFLEKIGLTKNEIKVYVALLKIGRTTTSRIIKETTINTSKVYESLERLLRKGLVSYAIIKNRKNWSAESPSNIKEFLKEEKKEVEKNLDEAEIVIEQLNKLKTEKNEESTYAIFEGIKGIKTVKELSLEKMKRGDIMYIILATYPSDENLEAYFIDFQKRRAKKGIKCKYILNESFRERKIKRENLPLTEVKYVSTKALTPTWIEVFKDYVDIGILGKKPSVFLIKNQEIAQGFINYFEVLWLSGKKNS